MQFQGFFPPSFSPVGTLKDKVKLKKANKNLRRENSDLLIRLHQLEALLNDMQVRRGYFIVSKEEFWLYYVGGHFFP